jgi:uncharacterized protein YcgL (UPF0745 family)
LNKNKRLETFVKVKIKNSVANTGFFVKITKKEAKIARLEKK